ncbi:hypothetical protein ASG67_04250 [Sphingomonas sp. Leaf339]|uniref:hypothetical protein n=1 Tax=Sphingomonas sp. Leaf339 TaxID=1736343 RepID=UPI0006F77CB1|nr:hypothetical protein [Sphingomonas sp. Leaf339]KQU62311.1 hypothetical protein ASG67_04250 [Sphingomonas sp. Leaf339]
MNPFSMVVAIVFMVMATRLLSQRYKWTDRRENDATQNADALRTQEEMRQLKERVAVLERVITDNHGSLGLDREIERLRDR